MPLKKETLLRLMFLALGIILTFTLWHNHRKTKNDAITFVNFLDISTDGYNEEVSIKYDLEQFKSALTTTKSNSTEQEISDLIYIIEELIRQKELSLYKEVSNLMLTIENKDFIFVSLRYLSLANKKETLAQIKAVLKKEKGLIHEEAKKVYDQINQ